MRMIILRFGGWWSGRSRSGNKGRPPQIYKKMKNRFMKMSQSDDCLDD
jgi:hypothetical protein